MTTNTNTTGDTAKVTIKGAYPFESAASVKAQLESDPVCQIETMILLFQWQTPHEKATGSTLNRNGTGFMSSHAANGKKIVEKIQMSGLTPIQLLASDVLDSDDWVMIGKIAPRYSGQVARYRRALKIEANPELRAIAALFSAG